MPLVAFGVGRHRLVGPLEVGVLGVGVDNGGLGELALLRDDRVPQFRTTHGGRVADADEAVVRDDGEESTGQTVVEDLIGQVRR